MSGMAIILVLASALFVGALGSHVYKQFKVRLKERMSRNEYDVAVTVWEYACLVRDQINEAISLGTLVLDFTKITVPHSQGYKVSLELIGSYFRIYASPERYARTGMLSFVTDNTLVVRAADHAGEQATSEDSEYKGEAIE